MKGAVAIAVVAGLAIAGTTVATAYAFDALVTACHDGDTCTVAVQDQGKAVIHVRLHGIDAPELDQPYGIEARALVLRLVLGRHVDLRPAGRSHDRLVADIVLADGTNVSAALVDAGAAWVDPRYSTDLTAPARQAAAQQRHAGLWADSSAVPPWAWRRAQHAHGW